MPPKSWANPMRKRSGYEKYDFKIDDREYMFEVPDGVTTQIIQKHTRKKRELYEKIASLAIEKGYEVDKDTPPMPLVNKEKYADLIRDAKIALGEGWKQKEKIYIKNIDDIVAAPYASIFPINTEATVRKKRVCRKKSGPPAAGDDPDEDCDDDDEDDENPGKMPAPAPAAAPSSSAMPMRTPADNPYRTQYTDSMGRVSVTYIANDPKYKEIYAIDQHFNKVYFYKDERKSNRDPLNHRPTQIGYIEGPGLPKSGEEMSYMKAVSGETQKELPIPTGHGTSVYGGIFIYLLKPANKLVLLEDVIQEMKDEKERKEQAEYQAWFDTLTLTTYNDKPIYYEPYSKETGTYQLYSNAIEEGVYKNVGDYYPDSNNNPVFDEKNKRNFGIQLDYGYYDSESDESESEKSSSDKEDHDYYDPHDDIPRFHPSEMVSTTAPTEPVAPAPATAPPPAPAPAPSEPKHPPLSLPDGWRVRWSKSSNQWTFVDPATGMQHLNPPGKSREWRAYVSRTHNKWYYKNSANPSEHEWKGGKQSKKKGTKRRSNKKKTNGKKTKKSRSSKKTKKSRKGKNTKVVKITLRKVGKKNVRHHYTLDATSKKRHMAIAEGVNKEAKKTNRTRKQAAVAKKARLNVLRMYRKNNNSKHCNIITRDMEYMDRKYDLGKTVNICKK
jgi:hypothetical protein